MPENAIERKSNPMTGAQLEELLLKVIAQSKESNPAAIGTLEEAVEQYDFPRGFASIQHAVAALQQMEFDEAVKHLESVLNDA